MYFNGNNQYIQLPSGSNTALNITSDFTVSFWMKSSQKGANAGIIGLGDNLAGNAGFLVAVGNGGVTSNAMTVMTGNKWYTASKDVTDDQWHNITVVLLGSKLSIFVDANLDLAFENASKPFSFNGTRTLGARNNAEDGFYVGSLDDVRIYNRALIQSEITYLATH